MKQYMLISVVDREIETAVFPSKIQAQLQMLAEFAEAIGEDAVEEILQEYDTDSLVDLIGVNFDTCAIEKDSAWANDTYYANHADADWKIVELDAPIPEKVYAVVEETSQEEFVDHYGDSAGPAKDLVGLYTDREEAIRTEMRLNQKDKALVDAFDCVPTLYSVEPVEIQSEHVVPMHAPKIAIEVRGGLVQKVYADTNVSVEVLDFDTANADEETLAAVADNRKELSLIEKSHDWFRVY